MAKSSKSWLGLPGWVTLWLVFTSLICTWDASFIVLRPHTLPGGKYNWFWKPYDKYIQVDKRYGDMHDAFVVVQSLMNYAEIFINLVAVLLSTAGSAHSVPLAFTSSLMTWWKTVCYAMHYLPGIVVPEHALPTDVTEAVLFFWIPTAIWLLVPLAVLLALYPRLVSAAASSSSRATGQQGGSNKKSN